MKTAFYTKTLLILLLVTSAPPIALAKENTAKAKRIEQFHIQSIKYESNRQFSKAVNAITKAIRLNPKNISFFVRRGDLYYQLERYSLGRKDFTRALNIVPVTAKDYYLRANAFSNLNNYEKALECCDKAISKNYTNQKVYKLKGKCYYKLNKFNQAIEQLELALKVKPTVTAYLYLSRCYRKLKKPNSSDSILVKARELSAKAPSILEESAIVKYQLKDYKQSKAFYKTWCKNIPARLISYPDWKAFLFYCETEKKIDHYSEVIALSKNNNAAPIYERALLNLSLARYETAAQEMKQYLKLTNWKGRSGVMAASYAIICSKLSGKKQIASQLTSQALNKLSHTKWPYPVFVFTNNKVSKKQFLAKAKSKQQKTVAHYFIGLTELLNNKNDNAIQNLSWVKANGDPGIDEYSQALAELDRIKRRKALR